LFSKNITFWLPQISGYNSTSVPLYVPELSSHACCCCCCCCCCCWLLRALQIVVLFVQLAVLGAAIGLAFGLVTSFWLARIFNDACLEIILRFGSAYACYFVAELCGASGLLAVVVMGFSMSVMGELRVSEVHCVGLFILHCS
jgi:hypothetical protein